MAKEVKRGGATTYVGADGKTYTLDLANSRGTDRKWDDAITGVSALSGDLGTTAIISAIARGGDDYRTNNLFRRGNMDQLSFAIELMLQTGSIPTQEELRDAGLVLNKGEYSNIEHDLSIFLQKNNISAKELSKSIAENREANMSEQDKAYADFNSYYRDAYSLEDDTTGKAIYDSLLEAERQNALSNMQLADAQQQYSAMQQAETVKAITDQVRAERMEKLRAGMSEAQIANTEMQTLMNNVNTLNQQASQYNLARLQAQQQYDNAQHTAYQQWLSNANTMGQIGAAYSASDAGDINQQALRIMRQTGLTYEQSIKLAQGNKQ